MRTMATVTWTWGEEEQQCTVDASRGLTEGGNSPTEEGSLCRTFLHLLPLLRPRCRRCCVDRLSSRPATAKVHVQVCMSGSMCSEYVPVRSSPPSYPKAADSQSCASTRFVRRKNGMHCTPPHMSFHGRHTGTKWKRTETDDQKPMQWAACIHFSSWPTEHKLNLKVGLEKKVD
jgi:hypothetical protein